MFLAAVRRKSDASASNVESTHSGHNRRARGKVVSAFGVTLRADATVAAIIAVAVAVATVTFGASTNPAVRVRALCT